MFSRGQQDHFFQVHFVLVGRDNFYAGDNLALRFRSPIMDIKALSDYVVQVEDFNNETVSDVNDCRIKLYTDLSLYIEFIIERWPIY